MPWQRRRPLSGRRRPKARLCLFRGANKNGGAKAVKRVMQQLEAKAPIQYVRVIGALYPDMVREAIRDQMAEARLTEQDIRELLQEAQQKLERISGTKH